MADRCLELQLAEPAQRHLVPGVIPASPVQRRIPAGLPQQCPAVGEPQLGPCITTIGNERQVFAVGDQSIGKLEILDELPVPGRFAIEGETFAGMADVLHAAVERMPAQALAVRLDSRFQVVAVDRMQGALREDVLDVHEQQFLVLLLVLQTQLDPPVDFIGIGLGRLGQQFAHGLVHVTAVTVDVLYTWA